jgi:hypothetical protein
MKQTGKRSAGKPHAAFDVAGAGNVTMVAGMRSIVKAMELPPAPTVRAPALDPTRGGQSYPFPSRLANAFATFAFSIFFLIRKAAEYHGEFATYPARAQLETNFWPEMFGQVPNKTTEHWILRVALQNKICSR